MGHAKDCLYSNDDFSTARLPVSHIARHPHGGGVPSGGVHSQEAEIRHTRVNFAHRALSGALSLTSVHLTMYQVNCCTLRML